MLHPITEYTHSQAIWLTAPSRAVVNYSAPSDRPTDRRAYRETEHQSETQTESRTDRAWDGQTGRPTDRQKAVDHQNLPPGIFLFIINTSIEFNINLCAFTVPGFWILKETCFEMQCVPSHALATARKRRYDSNMDRRAASGFNASQPITAPVNLWWTHVSESHPAAASK